MTRLPAIVGVLLTCSVCGCLWRLDPSESFLKAHYVTGATRLNGLDGPYKALEAVSPTSIAVDNDGTRLVLTMRGCLSTGEPRLDAEARRLLGTLWPNQVWARRDCSISTKEGVVKTVVYEPGNQVNTGRDEQGRLAYDTVDYLMPQLLLLFSGYCLLDTSDTNYPLYGVFAEAQNLAKRYRKGYWAKGEAGDRGHP